MITKLIIKKANKYLSRYGRTARFVAFENKICKTHNAKLIYEFAKNVTGADIDKCLTTISETNNAEYIYLTALFLPVSNITPLQNAIINTNNAEYIYKFSCFVEGADKIRLHRALLKTHNATYLHKLGHYFDTIDILEIEHEIKRYASKKEKDAFYNDCVIVKKLKEHMSCTEVDDNTIIKDMINQNIQQSNFALQPIKANDTQQCQDLDEGLSFLSEEDRTFLLELEQAFSSLTRASMNRLYR